MNSKKVVIAGLIALSFLLLVVSAMSFLEKTRELRRLDPLELESMTKEDIIQTIYERHEQESTPFYYAIPLFGFFGVAVGTTMYFILSSDLERKDRIIRHNTDVILKLLDPEERKVVSRIVENGGRIQQSELTYREGYTKVQAHRIVEKLLGKGILTKEAMGKMRLVRMNEEFYSILKKG